MDLEELESFLVLEETAAPTGRRRQEVGGGRDGVGVQADLEVPFHGHPKSRIGGNGRLFRRAQENLELCKFILLRSKKLTNIFWGHTHTKKILALCWQ